MQSSTHTLDGHAQPDGSRYVYEVHVDDTGRTHTLPPWRAPAGMDVDAVVSARAVQIDESLAEAEANALLEPD